MAQKVLVIVGPTASGKSALAVELAKRFDGEIISADSRQVYRGLDIGTGKITAREMRGVPHHLLDVASAKRTYTAHDFLTKGRTAIADIATRDKLPIVAGGTGFYVDALVGRISLPDIPADPAFRRVHALTPAAELYSLLQQADPERAETIDPHNRPRLIRALEIAASAKSLPMWDIRCPTYDTLWIGLDVPKAVLDEKIDERLKARMKHGMVAEAKYLHAAGLSYKRMEALGLEYRSLARLLQKKVTRVEMLTELSHAIKQYAKRQRTYWRRNKDIEWFSPTGVEEIYTAVTAWLSHKD